ncbi:NAD(P)H-binding protein [Streptomyces sp. H10-C2]|uniref:SDR family oxidoreductase n=1 Tax=unclassified Streptomyces TaxID=2593676 RepID=UPI0024B9551D|nr:MULTISPECIES: NAD(P)H-binding protein [unclassified Streptomyces]MDJ0343651.1 NAD(P)H-binding protein [Streptomyces sp. PH10-H1]MDJ0373101.1 NAD(P)H-binding protein [Streptomyces sp. H10-C2]
MILVTGATGNLGRPLIAELAARGRKVRALTRTPGGARLPAGVEPCDSTAPDFDGVTALVVNIAGTPGSTDALLDAAKAAGVRRVVTVSALVVADDEAAGEGSSAAIHRNLETAVAAAFPQWTHLRPGAFAANALQWKAQLTAGDVVRGPYAGACTAPIHEADIAAVAVQALLGDELLGQAPSLTGPHGLTTAEQVAILGAVLARPLRFEEIPAAAAKQAMLSHNSWVQEEAIDSLLRYLAGTVGKPALVTGEVERILGRPALTYAQWAEANVSAFQN